MSKPLLTRAEIDAKLEAARAELIECEDCGNAEGAELARCRCDSLLDELWQILPKQRTP